MSIFKRGRVYWYHFVFNGQQFKELQARKSRVARQMEQHTKLHWPERDGLPRTQESSSGQLSKG